MKTRIQNLCLALAVLTVLAGSASAAVTFTVTPPAISNTYSGTITLQISGLTSGDTVVVQKYLDANANGIVDAGDHLWQQFQLKDGQASVFTNGAISVTNFNVPGDMDGSANGKITAQLYPSQDFAQLIIGKYIFVLSSPLGHFAPMTNSFSVTNFPFGQMITGNVVSNTTPVPDAIVLLFQPSGGGENPQGGVVANNSGAYTVKAPTGTYLLCAVKSNFVANLAVSPYVSLGAGAPITTNVPLMNTTESISGSVVDANNAALGLAGLLVPMQTTNDLLTLAFTDTNGNYSVRVSPGIWQAGIDSKGLLYKGYLEPGNSTNVIATNGSVSGVTISAPKATAIFYGTVKNNLGNPMPGIDVEGDDNVPNGDGEYDTQAYTYASGSYVAGVLAGDSWEVYVDAADQQSAYTNYLFSAAASQENGGTNFSAGRAVLQNFTGIPTTAQINGYVQDSDDNPVSGLGVNAMATISGVPYQAHADTDGNGYYSLNLANGNWTISLNCGDGGDGLGNIYGDGNFDCPANLNVSLDNDSISTNFTVVLPNSGLISGYVTDPYGNPVPGLTVYANDGVGDIYSTTTDGNGFFSLAVQNGNVGVSLVCSQLNPLGYECIGTNDLSVSSDSVEADFSLQFITPPIFPFTVLHGFSVEATNRMSISTNSDGAYPVDGLVLAGNTLYGTTSAGGTNGNGTVFALNTNLNGLFRVVHTFTALDAATQTTNSDGAGPFAGLILAGGTLYGTVPYGGTYGNGTVFKVSTNGTGFTVLHTFTGGNTNAFGYYTNKDGANPYDGLVLAGNTLYGTASDGGTNGQGTVFAIGTNGGTLAVMHTFTALDTATQTTNSDGSTPYSGLILSGNILYGTANVGGSAGYGTVFKLATNGTGFAALYSFTNGDDGANPYPALVLSSNVLYGTAAYAGNNGLAEGTVFAITTNGTGFTVLHTFTGNNDGGNPYGGLVLASNALCGAAADGGADQNGTVYSVGTDAADFTVLHTFTGGSDGATPEGALILSGNILYGTALGGGASGDGTVFDVSAMAAPSPPKLTIIHSGANVVLMWPANASGFVLQSATNLVPSTTWSAVPSTPGVVNGQNTVTNPISGKQLFYRLNQ